MMESNNHEGSEGFVAGKTATRSLYCSGSVIETVCFSLPLVSAVSSLLARGAMSLTSDKT
jgi:hypothetical protein